MPVPVHPTPVAGTLAAARYAARAQAPGPAPAPARELPDIDWGEEIPTLVQRPGDPTPSQPPPPPQPETGEALLDVDPSELVDEVDEDGEEQPTRVERHEQAQSPLVQAALKGAAEPARESPRSTPEPLFTEQALRAQAERLAVEAARLVEQSRAALALAERTAARAKGMSEAAAKAAEAVQVAPSAGLVEAGRRLTEALALEQALPGPIDAPPIGAPAPQAQPAPPHAPVAHPEQERISAPSTGQTGSALPAVGPSSSAPPASAFALARTDDDSESADAFRSRLNPTLFGLPRTTAIALIAGAVLILLLILILRG